MHALGEFQSGLTARDVGLRRKQMIRHRWIAAAVVAAVMGMALTGCSAGGRAEQDETQPSGTGIAGSETDMES